MNLIPLDKVQKKAVEFVKKFVTKDQARPVLTAINVKDGLFRAADGFSAVISKIPELQVEDGYYRQDGNFLLAAEDQGNYPDLYQIIPDFDALAKQDNCRVISFYVDPSLLQKALDTSKTIVKITVAEFTGSDEKQTKTNSAIAVQTRIDDFETCSIALVMPMLGYDGDGWYDGK